MPKKRRTSKKNSTVTFLTLGLLVVLGLVFSLTGQDPGGFFATLTPTTDAAPATSTAPVVNVPTSANASGAWWEVYFTDPLNINDPGNWQASVVGRLVEKINAAQTSIHIASFEFDLTPVAEALIAARQRGVDVRWVTDDENGLEADEDPGHGQFTMLQAAGIEVRSDERSALMHNKFWIFDRQTVWTGSTNITGSGVFKQNNNVLVIHSPQLAEIYEAEFDEMWNGQFGPRSPSQLDTQAAVVNGSNMVVVFTSEDSALEDAIIPVVMGAQSSIRFLAFSFTDYPLAQAMIDRAAAGVSAAGVYEKFGSETDAAEMDTLLCGGVPVRQDGNSGFMHNKLIIIDDRIVITGSLNFSTNAEDNNDENVIIIDNPEIAQLYVQEFDRIWSLGTDLDPASIACS
ncbi:MAG TPA: phospholipase D-like domain-containing protein [Anaerolineales bacterium]|nr:phospholipase D-like domain-containing protein [Anaerolineales bacterium]